MDPFATFSPEVVALILESCSDFASLDGLLKTSARADQVFRQYYKTITEKIMKNCPIISQGLQYEFRNFILLEAGKFIPSSLPELIGGARTITVMPLSLPSIHSFDAVREAVSTAASIYFAASACLSLLLDRLAAAEPRRVVGPVSAAVEWVEGRWPEPPNETFRVKSRPLSWCEIYRMHRVLWTLATFQCVHRAATIRWPWSSEDRSQFTEQYVDYCQGRWKLEELQTASECLKVVYPEETVILDLLYPFLVSIPSADNSARPARLSIPEPPSLTTINSGRLCVWSAARRNGAIGSHGILCRTHRFTKNPLLHVDFGAYRRIGIPIWDDVRLHRIGLVPAPGNLPSLVGAGPQGLNEAMSICTYYTWWSLANEGDIYPST
ncbi:hypothetical protein N7447_004278 [Penicillium robsamsonii]|uniref:uncharacterized protein n=1 Tax=Penicillium robsamsonii TaxID=1792511 RepID=UPI002549A544|nr:uncharacterized protein N7447_004278 [Penicillium robsamsonii]KAJ5827515.1 hypothetical protein N7447_004278 [Penicillium robsamsonii]